ncbi:hypothetical protein [Bacillus pumilus]|uniref:hypothetical protein n=1 Tax=Bacillus pumilus TaxID=1408 RepID=UPI0011A52065|nr:hypothetical protein [Bacillus pumilus]
MTETKYKTEKRKARIGEQILITNVSEVEDEYENGDVFEVARVNSGCSVDSAEGYVVLDYEYEVIIGEKASVQNLDEMDYDDLVALSEAVMKALRARSYKNGYDQGRIDVEMEIWTKTTEEKSIQRKRNEVVAKAKSDVAFSIIKFLKYKNEFIVNSKKRTVVALRKSPVSGHVISKGIAKCSPSDCFNVHIGMAIALRRALGYHVPTEYFNAPLPTEVHVGDIVAVGYRNYTVINDDHDSENEKSTIDTLRISTLQGFGGGFEIIDDSRVGEGE